MARLLFEPMSVGQILDRAFVLYRHNFARFIAIVAIVQVPVNLLMVVVRRILPQLAAGTATSAPELFLLSMFGLLLLLVLMIPAQQLSIGALAKCVSESYLGNEATVGQVYRFVWPKLWRLLGATLLVLLIVIPSCLFLVPGVMFYVWFMLTSQTIVIEDHGAIEGMTRSKSLIEGNFWKALGLFVVVFVIAWIVGYVFKYAGDLITQWTGVKDPLLLILITQPFLLIGEVLVAPISGAALILLYYDLRIRKEGFDLEMLARTMGSEMSVPDIPPVRPGSPA